VTQPLNEKDVDRIASRVAQKLVMYAVVIFAAIFVAPIAFVALVTTIGHFTSGLPFPAAVAITASVIATPLVALIWLWGRRAAD
jgi:hypothetical protein